MKFVEDAIKLAERTQKEIAIEQLTRFAESAAIDCAEQIMLRKSNIQRIDNKIKGIDVEIKNAISDLERAKLQPEINFKSYLLNLMKHKEYVDSKESLKEDAIREKTKTQKEIAFLEELAVLFQ